MTTPTVPETQHGATSPASRSRPWTIAALLTQVFYVLWLPLMFAFGYMLGDIFGYDPGTEQPTGLWATAASVAAALLVIPLPSWVGMGLAVRARRLGARSAALVALVLCALTCLLLILSSLPL